MLASKMSSKMRGGGAHCLGHNARLTMGLSEPGLGQQRQSCDGERGAFHPDKATWMCNLRSAGSARSEGGDRCLRRGTGRVQEAKVPSVWQRKPMQNVCVFRREERGKCRQCRFHLGRRVQGKDRGLSEREGDKREREKESVCMRVLCQKRETE